MQLQLLLSQILSVFAYKRDNKQEEQLLQKFLSLGILSYVNQDISAEQPSSNIVNQSHGKIRVKSLKTAVAEMVQLNDVASSIPPLSFNPTVNALKKFNSPDKAMEIHEEVMQQRNEASFGGSMEMGATVPWPKAQPPSSDDVHIDSAHQPRSQMNSAVEKSKTPMSWVVDVGGAKEDGEDTVSKQPPSHLMKRLSAGSHPLNQSEVNQSMDKRSTTPTTARRDTAVRNSYSKWNEDKEHYQQQQDTTRNIRPESASRTRPSSARYSNVGYEVHDAPVDIVESKPRPRSAQRSHQAPTPSSPDRHSRPSTSASAATAATATTSQSQKSPSRSHYQQQIPIVASYSKHLIYQTNVPLRCATELMQSEQASDDTVRMAIGSNAKNIQVIKFSRHRLHSHHGDVNEIQDNQQDIEVEYVLENVHKGSVYAMDWHMRSQLLASGSNDKAIRVCR